MTRLIRSATVVACILASACSARFHRPGQAAQDCSTFPTPQPTPFGEVAPPYDKRDIERAIARHFDRLRECFERGLRLNPRLTGQVVTTFQFGEDGRVRFACIKSSEFVGEGKDVAEQCIARAYLSMRFPEPERGTVKVSYPMVFRPRPRMWGPEKPGPR